MKHLTLFAVALLASLVGFAQDHDVTFKVNTSTITVGPNGMFIGGGAFFGDAMGHAMSDTDGDGRLDQRQVLMGTTIIESGCSTGNSASGGANHTFAGATSCPNIFFLGFIRTT